jgi:hypothetical protein
MSTSVYTGLNAFNFIHKLFLQFCIQKVTVHLWKVLEVMSTSVYTGQNPFNPFSARGPIYRPPLFLRRMREADVLAHFF